MVKKSILQNEEEGLKGDEILRRKFKTPDIPTSDAITNGLARRLESFDYFFIATSSRKGECDSSYRGKRNDNLALIVVDSKTIVFPDYPGNGSFRSLGNILENPQIGMLFIDFTSGLRIRINGDVKVIDDPKLLAIFPGSIQAVRVNVREVYKQNRPVTIG